MSARVALSVIIPVGPGDWEWEALVQQLADALPAGTEVLLAAGAAVAGPVRCVVAAGRRGAQSNAAAGLAAGEWLWFLHADSRLDAGTVPALLAFVGRGEVALGWFDLAFRPGGPRLMKLNAWGANRRSAWFGMPFGDQGFVLPARSFRALGGFDERAGFGEDHLFVWAARRAGLPLRRVGARLFTSARTYERGGWARTTARHVALTVWQVITVVSGPVWRRSTGRPGR